jgi:hypothetical protein
VSWCVCRFYGFKNMQHGVTTLEKLTATELKHIASVLYLLFDDVCVDDSQHTLARAVRYLYRFHVYTAMAMKTEHTDDTLAELARYADGLLTCLKDSPLLEERPSEYLFVKTHILFFLLPRCIKNMVSHSRPATAPSRPWFVRARF